MRCRCGARMKHSLPKHFTQKSGFWFECPECGNRKVVQKFTRFIGKPLTPMGDPYNYE